MKKIISRIQFEKNQEKFAKKMEQNKKLKKDATKLIADADKFNWLHQTRWLGEPILNTTTDMFAMQEIIYKTKPDYIIEVGVAWGGSLLFYSTLMEIVGGKKIIGVDIFIPEDLKKRIKSVKKLSKRIHLITGSSTDISTIEKIKKIVGNSKRTLVILDSDHTHKNVLKELEMYHSFVGKNFYLICQDTIVENIPEQKHRPRPWKKGNNPMTALREFLKTNKRFKSDRLIENKLLLSLSPEGYLKAIKE